ncbi:endonuclease VII domain-containing protein [Streptomyces sp. NPDC055254]
MLGRPDPERCARCGEERPRAAFPIKRSNLDGLRRECRGERPHAEWRRNATASDGLSTRCEVCRAAEGRAGHLRHSYDITEARRDEMIAAQGGPCRIRPKAPAVHVDHCHATGRVRGVPCFNCNSAIGKLGDDPDTLRRAISYLEGHAWKPTIVAQGVYRQPS